MQQILPKIIARPAGKTGIITLFLLAILLFGWSGPIPGRAATAAPGAAEKTFPAPGADALNLKISKHYQVAADGRVRQQLYVRRRILTYKGKKAYADFKYTYNQAFEKARLVRARTFKADGTIVAVGDREVHDIPAPWNSEASLYSRTRQLVVNLPAVEPGCEIEIEIETTSRIGFWCAEYFRFSDPILDKEVVIEAAAGVALKFHPPARLRLEHSVRKNANGSTVYSWRARRVPGLPPARWAPDESEQGYSLLVSSLADNRAVAAFFRRGFPGLQESASKLDETPDNSPAGRSGKSKSDLKTESYRIFQELSRKTTPYAISFQETDMQVQPPARTAASGYGRDADLALLFYHRLKQRQLPARLLMVASSARFPELFGDFPWPGWWNGVVVKSGDDFFYFDTDQPAPGITGLDGTRALDLESGRLTTIHDREKSAVATRVELFPGPLPAARGNFTITLKGDAATGWRRNWRNLSPREKEIAASQLLHELNPTAAYTAPIHISGLAEKLKPLVFRGEFKVKELFTRLADHRFLLPLPAPDFSLPWPTLLENRRQPLAVTEDFELDNRLVLHFRQKMPALELPPVCKGQTANFRWQTAARRQPADRTLILERSFSQHRGIVPVEPGSGYRQFLAAVRALSADENLGLILKTDQP
jgi:hypothetical protein